MATIKNNHPDFNPKNNLASMPKKYLGQFYNACTDPCDMLQGPCACGAWHHQEEWPDEIQTEVFGFVSDKETICKRKRRKHITKTKLRGDKMGDVSMSGSGKMTSNTAYKAAYGTSNPKPKKLSCWKRLWQILNMPIRIHIRFSDDNRFSFKIRII